MEIADDFSSRLESALAAATEGDYGLRLPEDGQGAPAALAGAFNRLQDWLGRNLVESNIAISGLATANVRLMLWNEALQKINHADSILYHGGDIQIFYERIVADATEMVGARYGALAVLDDDGLVTDFITRGMNETDIEAIGRQPEGKGLLGAVLAEDAPVLVDDIGADPRSCGFPAGHPPMKTLLAVPMRIGDKRKGVIVLAEKLNGSSYGAHGERLDDAFTDEDAVMLSLFADYLARALDRIGLMRLLKDSNRQLEKRGVEQQQLIAKLHEAQNQLLQSEKMASIGQLAAGIAHEINNPIGFINSNIGSLERYLGTMFKVVDAYEKAREVVRDKTPECIEIEKLRKEADFDFLKEDIFSLMHETRDGVARVKKIVQDLKDFSHVDEAEWQWADLHKGLDSTLNVVWNELKYKAEVVKEYGELPAVECLPFQINQVFMNLLVNAAHAIVERGTITLRTGTAGEEVWVEIADTGGGIAPEHLARIFEPFFTTKPVGKGTGLGLSLSYGIVQKHHGRIEVTSEVGRGTAFRIWLPVNQPAGADAEAAAETKSIGDSA